MFIEAKSKPQCLVFVQIVPVPKEYNVKRHYKIRHLCKRQFEQYEEDARLAVLQDLKSKYNKQIGCITNSTKTDRSDKKASYEASLILAENGKAFRDGETVKKCAIKIALAFGEIKMAKKFETAPLSHQTVAGRVVEFNDYYLSSKVIIIVQ